MTTNAEVIKLINTWGAAEALERKLVTEKEIMKALGKGTRQEWQWKKKGGKVKSKYSTGGGVRKSKYSL